MTGKFIKVKCKDCDNVQRVFNKASSVITCQVCGGTLVEPAGGIASIKGEIIDE